KATTPVDTQTKAKPVEKRVAEPERKPPEPGNEFDSPLGGKDDPVMPGGKLELDRPMKIKATPTAAIKNEAPAKPAVDMSGGIPVGGKNWTAPASIVLGTETVRAGDEIWIWPQQDVAPKVGGGYLTIRFRWQLRLGKQLPSGMGVTLMIQEGNQVR